MDLLDFLLEDNEEEEAAVAAVQVAVQAAMANTVWMAEVMRSSEHVASTKKNTNWRLLPRKKKTKWRHSEALQCIKRDYFGCDSIPDSPLFRKADFVMMFRVSKTRVELMMRAFMEAQIPFYNRKKDCFGNDVPSLEARILLPLKTLAYGVPPYAFSDYFQMSKTMARKCCVEFDSALMKVYEAEYLRLPTTEDIKSITSLHKAKHGVDGMFGSIDCMHTRWKNCPKGWAGQYSGKEGVPTIVLEAIADHHLWFWHASYGYAGTLNDLNVLNLSPFLDALVSGKFAEVETGAVPYKIGKESFDKLFVLADGIYPEYCRFVKAQKEPITDQEKLMTLWQESKRKDIERAFGVLQGKFQWIARPIHLMKLADISKRVGTCLILHNMTVSDRIMGEVGLRYRPSSAFVEAEEAIDYSQEALERQQEGSNREGPTIGLSNMNSKAQQLILSKNAWTDLKDQQQHSRLHVAIRNYLYEQQQERRKKRKADGNNGVA